MSGQPKTAFYVVLFLVVAGLIAFAAYRSDLFAPKSPAPGQGTGSGEPAGGAGAGTEAADTGSVTTVKEYEFIPSERLPDVKGTSAYKPLVDDTVRFSLNVWAGWGPIILANEGARAGKIWTTPDGKTFKLELVLIDNPVTMRDAYASGDVHIGWGTLDMVPLFMEGFVDAQGKPRDSRVMPRIYQQIDWSNGGDGIVVRESVKTAGDLRGKTIVLAQNSPSHYFALNMLIGAGVQPAEVKMKFTGDAFQAAAAFHADKNLAGAVSWAPDIYNLAKVPGNRLLVSTATANKLIADVWFARADFAKDHPGIMEALVRGIFDGMEAMKSDANKTKCAELMSAFYNIPAPDTLGMLGDAHNTNWGENYQFFRNQNNPTNFERVWNQAYRLYRSTGSVRNPQVSFDQVMDYTIIEKLGKEEKYTAQKDEYQIQFVPKTVEQIRAESDEILTNTIVIHFAPNIHDPFYKVTEQQAGKSIERLYDPNVELILKEVASLVGQFGAAHIIIEGHTDSSMKGQVSASSVKELSENRANAVKQALVNKYNLQPAQFNAAGMGWDRPADAKDPLNQAKNRRVEIKVYSLEKQ